MHFPTLILRSVFYTHLSLPIPICSYLYLLRKEQVAYAFCRSSPSINWFIGFVVFIFSAFIRGPNVRLPTRNVTLCYCFRFISSGSRTKQHVHVLNKTLAHMEHWGRSWEKDKRCFFLKGALSNWKDLFFSTSIFFYYWTHSTYSIDNEQVIQEREPFSEGKHSDTRKE